MSLVGITSPLHCLNVGRKLDYLRCQRAVKYPPSTHWNFRRAALTSGKIYLNSHIAGFNARHIDQQTRHEPHPISKAATPTTIHTIRRNGTTSPNCSTIRVLFLERSSLKMVIVSSRSW